MQHKCFGKLRSLPLFGSHVFYSFYYKTIHKSSPNYRSLICYNFFYIHAIGVVGGSIESSHFVLFSNGKAGSIEGLLNFLCHTY